MGNAIYMTHYVPISNSDIPFVNKSTFNDVRIKKEIYRVGDIIRYWFRDENKKIYFYAGEIIMISTFTGSSVDLAEKIQISKSVQSTLENAKAKEFIVYGMKMDPVKRPFYK